MSIVQIIGPQEDLPLHVAASIYALATQIWPPGPGNETPIAQVMDRWQAQQTAHFVILKEDNEVLAHSLIFPRTVFTERGPITVGALANVCVHPDYRGRGWGADVVRAAFEYLPHMGVDVSLFQTDVQSFYEKLGGRLVTNTFVNGDNPNNPFGATCEMIYPATYDWPDGQIDINGPGY